MFKRKLRKEIEEHNLDFRDFMEKNSMKLKEEGIEIKETQKPKFNYGYLRAGLATVCICLLCFGIGMLPFLSNTPPSVPEEPSYGAGDTRITICENKEEYHKKYGVMALLRESRIECSELKETGKVVWLYCEGIYIAQNNTYIIKANVRTYKNFHFINQPIYDELKDSVEINGMTYYYGGKQADDGMYDYKVKYIESGHEVFLEIVCLNEDLTELLELI